MSDPKNKVLTAIAYYYYQSMHEFIFGPRSINNSVFMNIVNVMLRLKGFNGVRHERLDADSLM